MGYHIIVPDNSGYIRYYVEELRELADIDDINEQTIIYEGVESQYLVFFQNSKNPRTM